MARYKCYECNREFDEPNEIKTTYEDYYGVGHLFPTRGLMTMYVCPYCGDECIEEIDEFEEDEEDLEDE